MDGSPLHRLPTELRLQIYEDVFKPVPLNIARFIDHAEVDLLYASQATDKSLLLTCKALYLEAKASYLLAYRDFWSTSNFTIDFCHFGRERKGSPPSHRWQLFLDPQRLKKQVLALKAEDLEHISSLTIRYIIHAHYKPPRIMNWYKLLDRRGGWIFCPNAHDSNFLPWESSLRRNGIVLRYGHGSGQSMRTFLSERQKHLTMHHQILERLETAYRKSDGPRFDPGFCRNDSNVPYTLQAYDQTAYTKFSARQVETFDRYTDGKCLLV